MSNVSQANIVFIPGLYPNIPGFGERNRRANTLETAGALQSALGDLAIVHTFDVGYHDEGTPQVKLEGLYQYVRETAQQAGEPVHVAGASLGGNLAFGVAVRLGSNDVARGLAVSAPLRAKSSPPPGLRLKDKDDMKFVGKTRELLEEASPEDLARLTTVYGAHDKFVKPSWSQWDGIASRVVSGFWHPRIILKTLRNSELMRDILLKR
ncbi:MAG: alpha/beta hydrolase family protein [Candidatus Saccharimonadales bacterium]